MYRPELGIFGNIKLLFTNVGRIDSNTFQFRTEAEDRNTELEANIVETMMDEYNAMTEV